MKLNHLSTKIVPFVFLTVFALVCYTSQREKAVTVDEFNHFPAGIYNLSTLDWKMDRESPPLVKCLPGLTTFITKPDVDTKVDTAETNAWTFGYNFMFRNFNKYQQIFTYGRCAVILLGCIGGWILYRFGTEIYGHKGGMLALFFYVFNPNIIAHSRLTTIDSGATCAILLSIYCFWRFVKRWDAIWSTIAGGALGLAQLSKFTALLLYPIFLIIFGILILRKTVVKDDQSKSNQRTALIKGASYFFLMLVVSIIVINVGYYFSGSFTPLYQYTFLSELLGKISSLCWPGLPIPVPYDYLLGFDSQLAISEGNNPFYTTYLMGEHSLTGWWYYYIVAFIVKNPVAFLIILILSGFFWATREAYGPDFETGLCIWLPIAGFFVYFSFLTHIPIGIRFLLPVFPLFFLAAGYIYSLPLMRRKTGQFIMVVLAAGYVIPAISIFPNYLSYFNLAVGGPQRGHHWLIDSNLDWGQDMVKLKEYMDAKGIAKIKLGYFGRVDPGIYGIDYELAKRNVEKGIYAISVNFLVGRPYYLLEQHTKKLVFADIDYFKNYRSLKPVDIIGHTIHIFEVADGAV